MPQTISQPAKSAQEKKRVPYTFPTFKKPLQAERHAPKYLTENQVEHLIKVAQTCGHNDWQKKRNSLMVMMLFRHGLRRTEAKTLRWNEINFEDGQIHITRLKNGKMCVHPIHEREMRMMKKFRRMCPDFSYVFPTTDGSMLSDSGFRHIFNSIGMNSDIPFRIHPHMLRHACGFYLANKGVDTRAIQEYLGHKDISHTVVYTETAPNRFNNFWTE